MVDELLQHTAQVAQICQTLLQQPATAAHELTDAVTQVKVCAEHFSSLITELREILESADPIIHSMSSDLRTPLACMIGYPELMLQGVFGSLTDLQNQQATQLRQHVRELRAILETLMNNAKS